MTTARPRPWIFLALLCLGLALATGACASTSWPERGAVDVDVLRTAHPDEDVVVLEATRTVRYLAVGGEPVTEVVDYRRVLYLEPEEHGQFTLRVRHDTTFDEVREMSARVTRPDGDVREVDITDSDDFIHHYFALYSDERRRELEVDGLVPGAVLETRVVTRTRDVRLMPSGYSFGAAAPVLHEALIVEAPVGWEVDFYVNNGGPEFNEVPEPERIDGLQRWRWQRDDQPALEYRWRTQQENPYVRTRLARWTIAGREELGFADATELSAGKYAMVAHALVPDEPLDAVVAGILGDVDMSDPRKVVATLNAWVRDRISYCHIPIGYGGWVPHDVDQILDVGYGDCKDKATTLKAMLDTLGIESALANVYSHDGFPQPFRLPTIAGNFNHVILRVTLDGDTLWADPTASTVPFGEVPAGLYGAPVLALTPQGDPLEDIPVPAPELNARRVVGTLTLVEGAPALAELEFSLSGVWTHRLWASIDGASVRDKLRRVHSLLELRLVDLDAAEISEERASALPTTVSIAARGVVPGLVLHADAPRTLSARDLLEAAWPLLEEADSDEAFFFGSPSVLEHELHLVLPEGWRITQLPPVAAGQASEASYRLNWAHDEDSGELVLRSRFELTAPIVASERYTAVKKFLDEAQAAQTAAFVLTPNELVEASR